MNLPINAVRIAPRRGAARAASLGALVIGFLLVAVLSSCGGGSVGSGGTGAPVGLGEGTVTGFGSLIVDGDHYDTTNAPIVAEQAPGVFAPALARIGQHVELDLQPSGDPSQVRVAPELVGDVDSVATDGSGFIALGQRVKLNTDPLSGPVTLFSGGYTGAADVKAGQSVEVHGLLRRDASGSFIQATRVDELAAPPATFRIAGVVSGRPAGGLATQTFTLGALTIGFANATLSPADAQIVDGKRVVVFGPRSALGTGPLGNPQLDAQLVRVAVVPASSAPSWLDGPLSSLDGTSSTFLLDGVQVGYAGAVVVPANLTLSEGTYVRVRGTYATDGSFTAAQVLIRRPGQGSDFEVDVTGTVTAFDAVAQVATVRGVRVDTTGITPAACPSQALAQGLYVNVKGRIVGANIDATSIRCLPEAPGAVVDRLGVASAVDAAAQTFTLTPAAASPLVVRWGSTTYFGGVDATTLAGANVDAQGTIQPDGSLLAQSITLLP